MKGKEKLLEVTQEAAFFCLQCSSQSRRGQQCTTNAHAREGCACQDRRQRMPNLWVTQKKKKKKKEGDTSVTTCTAIEDDSNSPISNRGPSVTSLVALTSEPGWSPVPIWTLVLGHWPAVVSANTPHTDAANGLSVEQSLAQRVNQVHGVVLQDHQHVFALSRHTSSASFVFSLNAAMNM